MKKKKGGGGLLVQRNGGVENKDKGGLKRKGGRNRGGWEDSTCSTQECSKR